MQQPAPAPDPPPLRPSTRSVLLRQAQVVWLPLLLIVLNALLLLLSLALALLLLPFVAAGLALFALLRWLISTLSRGRLLGRRRRQGEEPEQTPANPTTLSDAVRRELALQYRPCLSVWPEDEELGPPYRTGETAYLLGADYHPRSVNLFLRQIRLRHGRTQWLPDTPDHTPPAEVRGYLGSVGESQSSLEIPWLHGGNPIKIVRHLFPFGRQLPAHWAIPVPKADCGCAQAVWQRYIRLIEEDRVKPSGEQYYPHTIYARVLQGRELPEIGADHPLANAVALQFWFFSYYNDAWNRHQGDWEGITVYLRHGVDGYKPLGAAFSCHDLGRWRRWQDLERVNEAGDLDPEGAHPMVYTARGSHASYFDYNENGYHPQMSRKLRIPFFGDYSIPSQFVLESRSAIDWVADAHSPLGTGVKVFTDNVRVMPPEQTLRDLPALRADDEWWWLAYRGLWGTPEFLPFFGGSGPRGPRGQGLKWSNPFRWVMRECIADEMPYWIETFAGWEAEDEEDADLSFLAQPQEVAR